MGGAKDNVFRFNFNQQLNSPMIIIGSLHVSICISCAQLHSRVIGVHRDFTNWLRVTYWHLLLPPHWNFHFNNKWILFIPEEPQYLCFYDGYRVSWGFCLWSCFFVFEQQSFFLLKLFLADLLSLRCWEPLWDAHVSRAFAGSPLSFESLSARQ